MTDIVEIEKMAHRMRLDCVRMGLAAGGEGAHMGGALSCVDVLATLYSSVMNPLPHSFEPMRDRLIMSKGHGIQAQYAALHQLGVIESTDLDSFKGYETKLTAHPSVNEDFGIDFATGSLGQGLSLGVGVALAFKRKRSTAHVYVLLGDGECDEGSVWEAAMAAAHYKLDNLTAIIDANHLQYDDDVSNVMSLEPFADKWKAFGWFTVEVDGHHVAELSKAFESKSLKAPRAIIARTTKGKGISFMENEPSWHAQRVTPKLYEQAMSELED